MNASRIIHLFLIIFLASLQASPSFAGDLDTTLYSRWPVTPPAIQVNDPTAVAALCTGASAYAYTHTWTRWHHQPPGQRFRKSPTITSTTS